MKRYASLLLVTLLTAGPAIAQSTSLEKGEKEEAGRYNARYALSLPTALESFETNDRLKRLTYSQFAPGSYIHGNFLASAVVAVLENEKQGVIVQA